MMHCEICDLPLEQCHHGLATKNRARVASVNELLVSPRGIVHFQGCMHKDADDHDFSAWATLDVPNAWQRLGNGEQLASTGGQAQGLVAVKRCETCLGHGPW